jgi:ferredoxin
MKVRVDTDLCQGHTLCTYAAPAVFAMGDDDKAFARDSIVPPELAEDVLTAAATCPEQAIIVE